MAASASTQKSGMPPMQVPSTYLDYHGWNLWETEHTWRRPSNSCTEAAIVGHLKAKAT